MSDSSMPETLKIRESKPADLTELESFYPEAFPDEDLLPLVRDLLSDTAIVLSLVAETDKAVVGHVIFTQCSVPGSGVNAALLGPLAVAPEHQRRAVGTTLVLEGLQRLGEAGAGLVCVLGDPAYYGRFGFVRESTVEPPYSLPAEWDSAWQSQRLQPAAAGCTGVLKVPRPWRKPALWLP